MELSLSALYHFNAFLYLMEKGVKENHILLLVCNIFEYISVGGLLE